MVRSDILLVGTTKQGGKTAFEIETDSSDDKEQRKNLREWARNHQDRTFRWGVVEGYPPEIDWEPSVDK